MIPPIRGHLKDVPAPLGTQDREGRLRDPEGPEEVRLDLRARLGLREFLDHAEEPVAGVVDDDVEPAELRVRLRHGLERRRAIGDVERDRQDAVAVLGGQLAERVDVARRRGDAVTSLEGGGSPDSSEAA